MIKKISIILIVLIIIIGGALAYVIFSKKDASEIPVISIFFPKSESLINEGEENKNEKIEIITKKELKKRDEALTVIYDNPVSSASNAGSGFLRYLDKTAGHAYESDFHGDNANKLSNTTILNIFSVSWGKDSNSAILKFLNNEGKIQNFSAEFSGSSTAGFFLPKNTVSAEASKIENKIAYIAEENGRGIVFVSDTNGKNKKQIISLPLSGFKVAWRDKENLYLISAPSALSNGFLYSLNLKTKELDKIYSGYGLSAVFLNNKILVMYYENGTIKNKVIVLGKERKEYNLNISSVPEKCAWSKKQENIIYCAVPVSLSKAFYPDDWHKGKISFTDNLYKINYLTGETAVIGDKISEKDFDAINLFLNDEENYLVFMDKKDNMLWRLQMNN